ncbi:MAG: glycosyltransferase family 39 protein [Planctomycetota bacterium]
MATSARPAFLFAFVATIVWTVFWIISNTREGVWAQEPNWDWANYHAGAMMIKEKLHRDGIAGAAEAWVTSTGVHPPFVQYTTALWMLVVGEGRVAAEMILVLYTFIFVYFTFRVVERLFDTTIAFWSTLLLLTFPVSISVSRLYLLEHPMSAVYAAAAWHMLKTEYFTKWRFALVYGLLVGIGSLSRLMGMVYFMGPGLVYLILALREPRPGRRFMIFGFAAFVAILTAASWYLPNIEDIKNYIGGATIGNRSKFYTGGISPISFESAGYYLSWIIYEGPGVPVFLIAILAFVIRGVRGGFASVVNKTLLAVAAVFLIDFCLLFPSGQRVGARYFLPLMPIVAIAVVIAVRGLDMLRTRFAMAAACAVFAAIPVVVLTFTTKYPPEPEEKGGPRLWGIQLWSHRSMFFDLALSVKMNPRADLRVGDVIGRVESAGAKDGSLVFVVSEHPYFQTPALRLESLRRGHLWNFGAPEMLVFDETPEHVARIRDVAQDFEYIISRTGGANYANDRDFSPIVRAALASGSRAFRIIGDPILLGDGSTVRVFKRTENFGITNEAPVGLQPLSVRFSNDNIAFELIGFDASVRGVQLYIKFWARVEKPIQQFPLLFMQFQYSDIAKRQPPPHDSVGAREVPPRVIPEENFQGSGPWYMYLIHETAIHDLIDKAPGEDITIGIGFVGTSPAGPKRFVCRAQDNIPIDDNQTRLTAGKISVPAKPSK